MDWLSDTAHFLCTILAIDCLASLALDGRLEAHNPIGRAEFQVALFAEPDQDE